MKYAFMSFSTPELTFDKMLEVARRYGYDGIEPRIDSDHAHGLAVETPAAQRKALRDQAADAGVAIACVATSLRYADPAQADEMIAGTHERIDLAGDLGAPALRVFGGMIPEGVTREQAMDRLVESLSAVADHAAERNVAICLETHDDWCDPRHVAEVLRRVDRPSIAANWDIMHPVRTGKATIDESFEALRPWIRHLHIHDGVADENGRPLLRPIGEGQVDHRQAMKRLLELGYDGFLSGEWIRWESYEKHLPRELETLRRLEAEQTGS